MAIDPRKSGWQHFLRKNEKNYKEFQRLDQTNEHLRKTEVAVAAYKYNGDCLDQNMRSELLLAPWHLNIRKYTRYNYPTSTGRNKEDLPAADMGTKPGGGADGAIAAAPAPAV